MKPFAGSPATPFAKPCRKPFAKPFAKLLLARISLQSQGWRAAAACGSSVVVF